MVSICNLVDDEEDVSDVQTDVAAEVRVKIDVTHRAFPNSIEVYTDKVSVSIDYRTA